MDSAGYRGVADVCVCMYVCMYVFLCFDVTILQYWLYFIFCILDIL
jgi:hypothetical protein